MYRPPPEPDPVERLAVAVERLARLLEREELRRGVRALQRFRRRYPDPEPGEERPPLRVLP